MTYHFNHAPQKRGLRAVRAEAPEAKKLLEELNRTVAQFKEANEERVNALSQKDTLIEGKVDKISAAISDMEAQLQVFAQKQAALALNDGDDRPSQEVVAYRKQFESYFRKGDETGVKASAQRNSNPEGGFFVPDTMETTVNRVLGTVSALRGIAQTVTISTAGYKKIVNLGGASSGWVSETQARPETTTPTLSELAFPVMELYANPYATQNLLDDASVNIAAWLADEVSITFAEEEGSKFISGNGVAQPKGLLSTGYDKIANASYAWGKLGYIATGDASSFIATTTTASPADCLIDLIYSLKQGYRVGSKFLMNRKTASVIRKFKDAQGLYLWADPMGSVIYPTLMGFEVVIDDNMPDIGANTYPIAFGDFNRGYLIVDRQGIAVLRDPYSNKPYVSFYTTKRVGGGIQNFEAIKLLKIAAS